MTYQGMTHAHDGMPLLRPENEGTVEVVEEDVGAIDELNGSGLSRRSRKGAALGLVVLALGAVSALSAFGGKPSSSERGTVVGSNLAAAAAADTGLSPQITTESSPKKYSELTQEEKESLFSDFVTTFEKTYQDQDERAMRFEIFKRNLKRIDEKNSNSQGVTYGVTMWTDLTKEEFKSFQTFGKISDEAKKYAKSKEMHFTAGESSGYPCQSCIRFPELAQYVHGELPTSFDWRDYGAVTKVKNQAYCGSCWTFSTTGCLEGAWYLAGHPLKSLSEQQLVACDTEWNQGCNGGWPSLAMDYIKENGGIVPEHIYPYRKVFMGDLPSPTCSDTVKDGNYAATLDVDIGLLASGPMAEEEMARWLILNGPLSVALDAEGMEYYSEGIDMGEYCWPLEIDHAVLIVGYGEENGVKFWVVKNSWKWIWGEDGYYRIVRGINACGIADYVTTILINDAEVAK